MRIYAEQMGAFEQAAWSRFEGEMVEHSKKFSPVLTSVIGEEQLVIAVRSAMNRAWSYGFTNRGPIRLFVELMFQCGSHFDTDPQYDALVAALRGNEDQMVRAEKIHEGHNVYLEEVSGPKAANVRRALRHLAALLREPLPFEGKDLEAGLRAELHRAFPQRARYVGEAGITMLIEEAKSVAAGVGFFQTREITLLVILMFSFGHGCANDPLYPWIVNTLRDKKITTPAGRAQRLERKAATWLTHVLARPHAGDAA